MLYSSLFYLYYERAREIPQKARLFSVKECFFHGRATQPSPFGNRLAPSASPTFPPPQEYLLRIHTLLLYIWELPTPALPTLYLFSVFLVFPFFN